MILHDLFGYFAAQCSNSCTIKMSRLWVLIQLIPGFVRFVSLVDSAISPRFDQC